MYLGHCNGCGYADPTPVEPAPPPPMIIGLHRPPLVSPGNPQNVLVLCVLYYFILPLAPNRGSPNVRSPMSSKSKGKKRNVHVSMMPRWANRCRLFFFLLSPNLKYCWLNDLVIWTCPEQFYYVYMYITSIY